MIIQELSSYVETHTGLLKYVLFFAVLLYFGNRVMNYQIDKDKGDLAHAQSQVEWAKEQVSALNRTTASLYQQNLQAQAALTTQIADAKKSIEVRQTKLTEVQKTDETLPVPQLAFDWAAIIKRGNLTPTATTITADAQAAISTVQALQQGQADAFTIVDLNKTIAVSNKYVESCRILIDSGEKEIDALKQQSADQDKSCKAEVAFVKAEARKSKSKWFKAGVVVGFVAGLFTGHAI